jgi:hypothetical protein
VPAGSKGLRLTALSGVNGLAQSLATLGRAPDPEVLAEVSDGAEIPDAAPVAASALAPPPIRRVTAVASPTPVRRHAIPGRAPVPKSRNVAALDKHLDLFMAQSLERADAVKRKALEASEARFRSRRDACRSEACQTAAYVSEMRTVSQIMASRQP